MKTSATTSLSRKAVLVLSVAIAALWAVARSGPQKLFHVDFDLERARGWPTVAVPALEQYTQDSAISPLLVQTLNIESVNGYLVLHVVAALTGAATLLVALYRMTSAPAAGRIQGLRLLLLAPIIYLLAKTVGSYDAFTVIAIGLMLLAWQASSRLLMIATGVIAGLQHFEQMFFALGIIWIVWRYVPSGLPNRLRGSLNPGWLVTGIVVGKLLLTVFLAANGASGSPGRLTWLTSPDLTRLSLSGALNHFPTLLLSFFAGLWGIAALYAISVWSRKFALVLVGVLAIPILLSVLAFDHTRVFVLITLPLLIVAIAATVERYRKADQKRFLAAAEVLAWVITPLLLFTSPDGPTFIFDPNVLDQWFMTLTQIANGGWS